MTSKVVGLAILAGALATPRVARAQSLGGNIATVITLQIQVNLTNLPSDLERVRLACWIMSPSYAVPQPSTNGASDLAKLPGAELYVAQGKAVGDMSVHVPILAQYLAADAVGKQATYFCGFLGYSTSLQAWGQLDNQQTNPTFRVSPAPPTLIGNFVW